MFASVLRNETSTRTGIARQFELTRGEARIVTARGEVPLSQVQPGDMLLTRDNGLQPVRRAVTSNAKRRMEAVKIAKGAMGNGMPHSDIVLSAHHRVLVTGELAALLFDLPEALIEARHLLGLTGVSADQTATMTHLECDHDEIVLVNGCWTEVFCAGSADAAAQHGVRLAELKAAVAQDAPVGG
ncbi:Hint domain-containing protein [Lacimonas salitolerans]|uniref:Hint domain-containing protein n=1 Tax=Lacimonas salitolerans TaxID=1323750 RepID=A0ABW4EJ66_9RHOB